MHLKPIRLLAMLATVLVIVSGIHALLNPAPPREAGPKRKPGGAISSNTPGKKAPQAALPCTIKRAAFGGTHAALLKFMKGRFSHYVVMDRPTDNPLMPFYQLDWIEANYGEAPPALVGEFATVEEAVARAAILCKRN